ncbi:MAG: RsmD family RNA methyltransferase, partial [Bacteroidota bacterium]
MEDWKILTHDRIQSLIEANLENDPVRFALTQSNNEIPVSLVSNQLKSLQKARTKLPLWYQKRAILPPLALEQCSSEATASLKKHQGERALDLSGGLGVDSYFLSQGFSHFVTLEVNPQLAEIQRYNLNLFQDDKIQVLNQSAEDYLAQYQGPPFDLIYVDPSRRGEHNQRINALTEGRPNILQLLTRGRSC